VTDAEGILSAVTQAAAVIASRIVGAKLRSRRRIRMVEWYRRFRRVANVSYGHEGLGTG
jgi:hypothetical protein